jgi:hypothetical protein
MHVRSVSDHGGSCPDAPAVQRLHALHLPWAPEGSPHRVHWVHTEQSRTSRRDICRQGPSRELDRPSDPPRHRHVQAVHLPVSSTQVRPPAVCPRNSGPYCPGPYCPGATPGPTATRAELMQAPRRYERPMSDSAPTPAELDEYVCNLSPQERIVLEIAQDHLESSFNLAKSLGFVRWREARAREGPTSGSQQPQ